MIFEDPNQDLRSTMKAIAAILSGTTAVAVSLRCYVRIFMQKKFRIDDFLILCSAACFYVFVWGTLEETSHGFGRHQKLLAQEDPAKLVHTMKFSLQDDISGSSH